MTKQGSPNKRGNHIFFGPQNHNKQNPTRDDTLEMTRDDTRATSAEKFSAEVENQTNPTITCTLN